MKKINISNNIFPLNKKIAPYISLHQITQKRTKFSIKFINFAIIFFFLLFQFCYTKYKNKKIDYYKEKANELEHKFKELKNIYERNEIKYSKKYKEVEEYEQKIKNLENEIKSKQCDFDKKENYYLEIIKRNNKTSYNEISHKKNFTKLFLKKINKMYNKKGCINLNKVESTLPHGRPWNKKDKLNEINIGSSLDPNYILRTMMTTASLMDSQKKETNLRLHFAVVNNFTTENMLKIYSLREKIKENVEFNFYNADLIEKGMKGQGGHKGNGLMAKLLLPQLLEDDIERIIIIDNGDILVLRDLTEMYNYNMKNKIYLGVIDQMLGKYGLISKKNLNIYINTGSYLIDVKKVKKENMFEKYLIHRDEYYNSVIADQDLINDIANDQIGYLPIKFGAHPVYANDEDFDKNINLYKYWNFYDKIIKSEKYPFTFKNECDFYLESYNPVIVHEIDAKWMFGKGLSIYRRIAQYYIKLAGIWEEICNKLPGYCVI